MITLEICTGSLESILAAREGGADRVEVCTALEVGGLTPSAGHIEAALAVEGIRKNVLIRPRGGDFCYNATEQRIIERDICMCRELGADGVVVGALNADGTLDAEALRRYRRLAGDMYLTFHRAFDVCTAPHEALKQLIDMGYDCILTSGQQPRAEEGVELLRSLVETAGNYLTIMPGSGVTPANARSIIQSTKAQAIHASATDKGTILHDAPLFPGYCATSVKLVAEIKAELAKQG